MHLSERKIILGCGEFVSGHKKEPGPIWGAGPAQGKIVISLQKVQLSDSLLCIFIKEVDLVHINCQLHLISCMDLVACVNFCHEGLSFD